MLSSEQILSCLRRELGESGAASELDAETVFDLDGSLRLGVYTLPDGSGHIAWSTVAEARPGESTAEADIRAAAFLRIHLGRLRRADAVTATRTPEGTDMLYIRAVPSTEGEWLRAVEKLLNETEAVRGLLLSSNERRSGGAAVPSTASLFAGMTGMVGRGGPHR